MDLSEGNASKFLKLVMNYVHSKADPGDDIGIGRQIVVTRNRRFKLII